MHLEPADNSPLVCVERGDSSTRESKGGDSTHGSRCESVQTFYSCKSEPSLWVESRARQRRLCIAALAASLVLPLVSCFCTPAGRAYLVWRLHECMTWYWLAHYGTIPVIAALVGYGTNAIAISMSFYPLEFRGCYPKCQIAGMPLCGWQGIIPSSVTKMATECIETMTTQMFDASAAVSRIDVDSISAALRPPLETLARKIIETIAVEYAPQIWQRLPSATKEELIAKCLDDADSALSGLIAGTGGTSPGGTSTDYTKYIDMKGILIDIMVRNKMLVNELFEGMAGKEYAFIRKSGFYLGFLFGLVQMYIWSLYNIWWSLPVAGFLVGYLTNFLALKVIFEPIDPVYIFGFEFQGLYLKRQREVAIAYGDLFSSHVLNAENLLIGVIKSPSSDQLFELLDQQVKDGIDKIAKKVVLSRRLAAKLIGREKYESLKARVVQIIREDMESMLRCVTPVLDEVLDVRSTLERSMNSLSRREFANMLIPAFKEGETKLIVIGGVLGALVGFLQACAQVPDQLGLE